MGNSVKMLLMLLLLSAGVSKAQNNALHKDVATNDSLYEYMRIAGENNPLVMQRFIEYKASLEKVKQVGVLPDPELTAGIFLSPMELVSGNQVAEINLMQMFPWFGVLKNSKDEMSLMALAKYEIFRDAQFELYFDVQRTWYQNFILNEQINIAEKNIALLLTIERLTLTRFKLSPGTRTSSGSPSPPVQQNNSGTSGVAQGGMNNMGTSQSNTGTPQLQGGSMGGGMAVSSSSGSLSDLYRIQMEIADLEDNIATLRNSLNTVRAQFNALLNRPVNLTISIPDSLRSDSLEVSLDAIADSMLTNNPMLSMIEYEQQSLEARRLMNTAMGYPMVGIGLNYALINESMMSNSEMNGADMIMPMVKVTLPVYRKKYRAMQQEAVLLKSAAENNYQSTVNTLQAETWLAVQEYLDAKRLKELYKNQYILAKKSLDLMVKDFSASGTTLTDILRIRQQTLDYEFKQVEAHARYNIAIAYIRRLMAKQTI